MKKIGRTLRVGFVVGVIFFGWWLRDIYRENWNFHLFSWSNWQYVWERFKSGWVIKTSYEWSWLLMVILMFPIFFVLWWISVKISWRKSFMTVFRKIKNFFFKPDPKKIVKKKIKIKGKASHKKVRPAPMTTGGRPAPKLTGRTMDADKGPGATTSAPAREQPLFPPTGNTPFPTFAAPNNPFGSDVEQPAFVEEDISNIPLDEIKLPERMRLEEDLTAILSAANYQVVQGVVLGKLKTTYVGISMDKIVVCLTDIEKGDWLADEEFFNEEEPLWFSENAHRISPVYALLSAVKEFAQKVSDHGFTQDVLPVLIEKEGCIINAADMMETWKKMGIIVCRTDLGGPEDLPAFGEALPVAESKGTEETLENIRNLF